MLLLGSVALGAIVILSYLLLCLVIYLLYGLALSRISVKMGGEASWQFFVPFFCEYRMGKLAEQACLLENAEKKPFKYGKVNLAANLAFYGFNEVYSLTSFLVSLLLIAILLLISLISGVFAAGSVVGMFLFYMIIAATSAILNVSAIISRLLLCALYVSEYAVLYKIYKAFAPDSAVWMLMFSVFFSGAGIVILLILAFGKSYSIERPGKTEES